MKAVAPNEESFDLSTFAKFMQVKYVFRNEKEICVNIYLHVRNKTVDQIIIFRHFG